MKRTSMVLVLVFLVALVACNDDDAADLPDSAGLDSVSDEAVESMRDGKQSAGDSQTVARIGGFAWFDDDHNGIWTEDEERLGGLVVTLWPQGGVDTQGSAITGADGSYVFDNLSRDDVFYLGFEIPLGLDITINDAGSDEIDSDIFVPSSGPIGGDVAITTLIEPGPGDESRWSGGYIRPSTPEPEIPSSLFEIEDGLNDCSGSVPDCAVDIERVVAIYDEEAQDFRFEIIYKNVDVPKIEDTDLSIEFDMDQNPTTGFRGELSEGIDLAFDFNGFENSMRLFTFSADGAILSESVLGSTEYGIGVTSNTWAVSLPAGYVIDYGGRVEININVYAVVFLYAPDGTQATDIAGPIDLPLDGE